MICKNRSRKLQLCQLKLCDRFCLELHLIETFLKEVQIFSVQFIFHIQQKSLSSLDTAVLCILKKKHLFAKSDWKQETKNEAKHLSKNN